MKYRLVKARPLRLLVAAGVVSGLALTACGGGDSTNGVRAEVPDDWDAVVEAAKEEGTVQLYFSIGQDVIDNLSEGFKSKYPEIDVEVYRSTGGSATLIERMENDMAAESWVADVVDLAAPLWLEDALDRGIVATDVDVPHAEGWDPEYWKDGTMVLMPTVLCVAYNTDLVDPDEVPTSWEEMADSRWADRMAIFEPRPDTDSHTNLYQLYLEEFGEDFITDITELDPRVWDNANSLAESVAAGESAIGPAFTHKAEDLKKNGAPLDYVILEPAPTFMNTTFVASDAPHPNAARVFLDYALSEDGQRAIAGEGRGNSLLDIPDAIENPEEMYLPDIHETAENYDLIMDLLGRSG
ncbi:ABC transporter substrate-binding protein [Jiangella asiatica]|uniref:Extracellular solute-binding protein n=1 Tax=Jiangella asiatica TaxID=2530372 RepID=A0A4R5D9F0_9ACTN|nr:extracellular solute-binding protein [Jiangella asiatica]TDE10176.1 extracellular solute-binding protein [Jiangella asiatica]